MGRNRECFHVKNAMFSLLVFDIDVWLQNLAEKCRNVGPKNDLHL